MTAEAYRRTVMPKQGFTSADSPRTRQPDDEYQERWRRALRCLGEAIAAAILADIEEESRQREATADEAAPPM